uniref:Dynein regulatory complex protein 1 n=1 Tax=Anas platyrhynchos TaxID=8839 RepID=A0A8B9QPK6_ANAPL
EEPKEEVEEEEEERRSHKEVEESQQVLAKLLFEGTQMVTNIQVAADSRETQRRAEEAELKQQRLKKLENEAKSSAYEFEKISSKWALAEDVTVPQELWQLLNQQQQQCSLLLEEKNKLIGELQQELKNKDEQYVQAMKKQSEDIHLLLERMEEQIRISAENLPPQTQTFEFERRELLDSNRKKWEEAIQAHNTKELEYLHARMRKVEEFEKQLNQLRVQDEEEYNSMKIQLENDVQNLERQLQQTKAAYLLNQEKLEYNLLVLKKQDEENTIIRSRQKRKINRLHSSLNNLRTKLDKQEKQFREENQSLAADCERITGQCKEVQKRMRHFAASDAEKFTEVWLMNEEEAKRLMRKALDADRIIHTQQLGLPWEQPRHWFLNNIGPLRRYKAKRMATKLAAEVLAGGTEPLAPLWHWETQFQVSQLASWALWGPFQALEIDSEDELQRLVDFFLKFKAQEAPLSQVGLRRQQWGEPTLREGEAEHHLNPQGSIFRGASRACGKKMRLRGCEDLLQSFPGPLTHEMLPKLPKYAKAAGGWKPKEALQVRDSSKDREYWEALAHVIPETTLKLWDALLVALEEYYNVLTRRASLLAELAELQQQNLELCLMLERYSTSGVSVGSLKTGDKEL